MDILKAANRITNYIQGHADPGHCSFKDQIYTRIRRILEEEERAEIKIEQKEPQEMIDIRERLKNKGYL